MKNDVILETKNLCKYFIGTKAVETVSLKILRGEIRGLIGENGSGKSTLASIIAGILIPNKGNMYFNGNIYKPANQIEANEVGISMMVQEMNTINGLTVAENVFLGKEKEFINRGGIVNRKKLNTKAKKLLEKFGIIEIDPDVYIEFLSFEDRKLIELAKSLYSKPKLFIIDEATTSLSQKGRNKLYETIYELKAEGCSVIFITHDLQELIKLSDSITILRDGELVSTLKNDNLEEDYLKNMMVGREIKGNYYRNDYDKEIKEEHVLEIKNIKANTLKNITFNLNKAEILGIAGLSESGMHDLGKVIYGAEEKQDGYIKIIKTEKKINYINDAISNGLGYVSKNRDQEAVMLTASIRENISLPNLDKFGKYFFVNPKKEKYFCEEAAKDLNVKMTSIDQLALYLSGGNKQKVALAKWISRESEILVLDSPTRGIDVGIKKSIYDLIQELVKNGISIIIISEEILELIGMCDRIIVLKNGEISKKFIRSYDLTEEKIVKYMI